MSNDLVKMHMPSEDAYMMGKIPKVKAQVNLCIDKVKTCLLYTSDAADE